jgi:GAF domain-containing protein
MKAPVPDAARLHDISSAFVAGKISRNEARSAVIQVIFDRIGCSRVSLWRFDGEPGQLSLLCFASRTVGGELDTRERRLTAAEYRDYFNALIHTGVYVGHDAQSDPHLQPMRQSYLVPNHVLSMLDATFMVNGRAYGMVCCEQTDALRTWRGPEVAAVRAIVSKLAMLMAGAGDPALWGSPSVPMAPI